MISESNRLPTPINGICLALSGGGTRAMVFHAGVLLFLSHRGLLEKITGISTVSGGSLLVGLVYKENDFSWPSSHKYSSYIHEAIKLSLCSKSMICDAISMLKEPRNFKYIFSRANLLAKALFHKWGVGCVLSDIPLHPEWSINGTTAETGKRFRFKPSSIGDYSLGYAHPKKMLLSDAMSVSAAFPGAIGPYSINTIEYNWFKRGWDEKPGKEKEVQLERNLRIYDGGVYDNLGLEAFFDQGRMQSKISNQLIICSDAGAPLKKGFSYWGMNPWRLKRVMDIISEQSRSLRVRAFMTYLLQNKNPGLYLGITSPYSGDINSSSHPSQYPTSLKKFSSEDFDKISDFGYKVAEYNYDHYIRTM